MIAYYRIVNQKTKQVAIVVGQKLIDIYHAQQGEIEKAWNGNYYLAGYVPSKPIQQQVIDLEEQYHMNRWQREGILAEGSLYSEYTKSKAQEIEQLAEELRKESL